MIALNVKGIAGRRLALGKTGQRRRMRQQVPAGEIDEALREGQFRFPVDYQMQTRYAERYPALGGRGRRCRLGDPALDQFDRAG